MRNNYTKLLEQVQKFAPCHSKKSSQQKIEKDQVLKHIEFCCNLSQLLQCLRIWIRGFY